MPLPSTKRFRLFLPYALVFCLALLLNEAGAQAPIEVVGVDVKDGRRLIDIEVKAINGKRVMPANELFKQIGRITEQRRGKAEKQLRLREKDLREAIKKIKTEGKKDTFRIIFLLDVSNAMDAEAFAAAKKLIQETVDRLSLSEQSVMLFSTFDALCEGLDTLSKDNAAELLKKVTLSGKNPDLNYCIRSRIITLGKAPGKKVLFVFSNGQNNIEGNPKYRSQMVVSPDKVIEAIHAEDPWFSIIPIALGKDPDTKLFQQLSDRTKNNLDALQSGKLPENLDEIIAGDSIILYTHLISVPSGYPVFAGETMTYRLYGKNDKVLDSLSDNSWGKYAPLILKPTDLADWLLWAFLGLGVLIAALGAFSFAIPVWQRSRFRKLYVRPYELEPGRRRMDPLTNLPIEVGELVVHRCSQVVPLATWEGLNWQCPNYPDCMQMQHLQCKGEGAPESTNDFFSLQGVFRRLNWLWFGAVGGFIGWLVFAFFKNFDFDWYKTWLKGIYSAYQNIVNSSETLLDLNALADNALLGVAFGFGLSSMLAIVEERSQSRKTSWVRIAVRILLGTLLSSFVFMFGFFLQFEQIIPNAFLAGLVTWSLFGLTIGFILSFKSSISFRQALPGGVAAALLGFFIYIGLAGLTEDYHLAKLISLLVQGAVLGWVLVAVTSRMEDFELEIISPRRFQQIVPISKWLKSNLDVVIGTEQGAYVYIKWSDLDTNALPRHAELHYDKGIVTILPYGETLVQGVLIPTNKKTPLRDGDIIQLGRTSPSQLRFKEKAAEKKRRGGAKPKSGVPPAGNEKARLDLRFDKK